jgi:hypothetical protein
MRNAKGDEQCHNWVLSRQFAPFQHAGAVHAPGQPRERCFSMVGHSKRATLPTSSHGLTLYKTTAIRLFGNFSSLVIHLLNISPITFARLNSRFVQLSPWSIPSTTPTSAKLLLSCCGVTTLLASPVFRVILPWQTS